MTRLGFAQMLVAQLLVMGLAAWGAAQTVGPNDPIVWNAHLPYCQQNEQTPGHPGPQFRPPAPQGIAPDADGACPSLKPGQQCTTAVSGQAAQTTFLNTNVTCLPQPEVDAFTLPPGTNVLPNAYTDMTDGSGNIMPNTLPSTPSIPYNLHDGDPVITGIDPTSPIEDLKAIFDALAQELVRSAPLNPADVEQQLRFGVAILQGDPLDEFVDGPRAYDGFPLLHYDGPTKIKKVDPETKTVKVHQIWYDEHIESDTALIDVSEVLEEPWIIEYTISVLQRGEDDFSPFAIYTDDPALTDPDWRSHPPGKGRLDHVGMDQTFFPMQQGTRTVLRIKMTPGKYLNLVYTWGWRMHPPRIQAAENALKSFPPKTLTDTTGHPVAPKTLPEWSISVFGDNPRANLGAQRAAIAKIGDLSPAKRMWTAFNRALASARASDWSAVSAQVEAANKAYFDWLTRSRLPSGVKPDPEADLTLLYVNNTIYGEFTNEVYLRYPQVRWPEWSLRGDTPLKVTLHNGDYYQHAYLNVDFGGSRGWENQFKSSVKVGGSGCWFTFGRAHWMINNNAVVLGAATPPKPGQSYATVSHKMHITYNFEPSTRLRFYQFDPMHHDVAIYSIH